MDVRRIQKAWSKFALERIAEGEDVLLAVVIYQSVQRAKGDLRLVG